MTLTTPTIGPFGRKCTTRWAPASLLSQCEYPFSPMKGNLEANVCARSSFASSAYTPAYAEIIKQFHVSPTVAVLPLSLYLLGLAFGPMIAGPLSETNGRKLVYFLSSIIFGLFTVGAGASQNMASLCICRFFAGTFGGSPMAVGGGSVADIWSVETRALPSGIFILMPFLGPAMG